ncbi:cation diffusion facilitator family transporter [Clostridium massiliamazoniense]|uniref:cation diffusion facilitator family transporter n=1 Tax=Clostridium massiliamazoniense TaxID=1347366 RepID=UPI0006D8617B|nr:cation diffusion facilitator family transporter [Clostridium massiliamazoniense]
MTKHNRKDRVASLSVASNAILIILKLVAGVLSGSISVISEAIHSSIDLVASIVAFLSVKISSRPADELHPYGYGKIENISGLIEGSLVLVASIIIILEAIRRIFVPTPIQNGEIAIIVMLVAAFVNFVVSRILHKVGTEEDSMALKADAVHLKTDVYISLGVGLGIILIKLTGIHILDPIIAIIVACLIIREALEVIEENFGEIIDKRLDDEEEEEIKSIIEGYKNYFIDYHKLKTRKSGDMKHVDFHIRVNPEMTVKEAHDIIGHIKKEMSEKLENVRVTVHIDPAQTL